MSHYNRAVAKIKSLDGLLAALRELGYHPKVHDIPVNLMGIDGIRPETAHVVIARNEVGGASNEVGYFRREDGTWEVVVSNFDRRSNFDAVRQRRIEVLSGVHADLLAAASMGLVAERLDLEGGDVDVLVYQV